MNDLFKTGQDSNQSDSAEDNQSGVKLSEVIGFIKVNSKILMILTIFSALASITVSLVVKEEYKASVMMVLDGADNAGGSLASLAPKFGTLGDLVGLNIGADPQKGTALAILESRKFTDDFFEEYDLLPYLFPENYKWDSKNKIWVGSPPQKRFIYLKMKEIMSIYEDRVTSVFTISVLDRDPKMAAKIANDLVAYLNQTIRETAVRDAELKIGYLNQEIAKTSDVESRQMLFQLIGQETRGIMVANTKEDYVFRIIDPASPPEIRFYPKRTTMVIMGTIIGSFLSIIFVYFYNNRREILQKLKSL
jgi:uncharacterized protein involved in exopolysaccharide biosynthesis